MGFFSRSQAGAETAKPAVWSYLISPGATPDEWETWKREGSALGKTKSNSLRVKEYSQAVACWPATSTMTLPVWIAEGGDAEKIVALELEARGATRAGDPVTFTLDETVKENGRRLFAVHLLRNGKAVFIHSGARWCDASIRWLPAEKDAIHLWLENGVACYALTRGTNIVFADSLRNTEPTASDFRSIRRVIQRLCAEGVLTTAPSSMIAFAPAPTGWREPAQRIFPHLRFGEVERQPTPPRSVRDISSTSVTDFRNAAKFRSKARAGVLALAAVLTIFASVAGIQFAREATEIRRLEATIEVQRTDVDRLVGIARDWQVVEPALTPKFYPLDILRDCAAQLPDTGARLTLFSVNGPEVVIQGEAANHPTAFGFAESVKKSTTLAQYEWEIPQPSLLPNNTASFQMRGTRRSNEKAGL